MQNHKVVSHDEWLAARKQFLAKEKEFTRLRDQLSEERRELPWESVDKNYVFDGPAARRLWRSCSRGGANWSFIISCSIRIGTRDARIAHSGPTTLMAFPCTSTIAM